MNVGMVCWALIGGQGRYRLATMIFSACTLLITLPIAFCLTLAMRYNLKGLTFAVVVGYSTTAMCLTYVLLMSNWEKISLKVQSKSKVDDVEYSDSSSTEGSSESESESTLREAHPAYEMSLFGSEVAADEGSSTFCIKAQPLASRSNQERPTQVHVRPIIYRRPMRILQALVSFPARLRRRQRERREQRKSVDCVEYSDSMSTEGSSESENESTLRETYTAYEMSLTQINKSSSFAADEGSATFYINAKPLDSSTYQERPREIDHIQGAQYGIQYDDQQYPQQLQPFQQYDQRALLVPPKQQMAAHMFQPPLVPSASQQPYRPPAQSMQLAAGASARSGRNGGSRSVPNVPVSTGIGLHPL